MMRSTLIQSVHPKVPPLLSSSESKVAMNIQLDLPMAVHFLHEIRHVETVITMIKISAGPLEERFVPNKSAQRICRSLRLLNVDVQDNFQ